MKVVGATAMGIRKAALLAVVTLLWTGFPLGGWSAAAENRVHASVQDGVGQRAKYLFYLHGAWLETHDVHEAHPRHGVYQYSAIVQGLTGKGFEVISEVRRSEVHPRQYASRVADRVGELLRTGVSGRDITVAGHSKGGNMALITAGLVQQEDVNYVILAGCGKPGTTFRRSYERFLERDAKQLRGRILSIYDSADQEAGSCREAFSQGAARETNEVVVHTGMGHGLFYSPRAVWIDKVVEWAD